MLTNFESLTSELNEIEMVMVPICIRCFGKYTKSNPIKAPEIVSRMKQAGYKLTEPRLRKIVNHIRSNSLQPLIATSDGYFVSEDPAEIKKQILSLYERAASIRRCADGLSAFLPSYNL